MAAVALPARSRRPRQPEGSVLGFLTLLRALLTRVVATRLVARGQRALPALRLPGVPILGPDTRR